MGPTQTKTSLTLGACSKLLIALALPLLMTAPSAKAAGALDGAIKQLTWKRYSVDYDFTVQREGKSPLKKAMRVIASDAPEGQRILATFLFPQNMKGTSFLAIMDRKQGDDEYFMFVRTLRRVKRVPNSTENFMLRDFLSLYFLKPRAELWNFEAMDPSTLDEKTLAELPPGSVVIQGTPAKEQTRVLTGYGSIRHVLDPKRQVILRTDFFDTDGTHIRRQTVMEFKRVGEQEFPWRFETNDLAEGVRATIEIRNIDFAPTISEDTFTVRYLKRL
jgi:uncharacterized protein